MITIQQVIAEVKSLQGSLVGISRLNKPLFRSLTLQCQKLERRLVSSSKMVDAPSEVEDELPVRILDSLTGEGIFISMAEHERRESLEEFIELGMLSSLKTMLLDDSLSKAEIIALLESTHEPSIKDENETSKEESTGTGEGVDATADGKSEGEGVNELANLLADDSDEDGTSSGNFMPTP